MKREERIEIKTEQEASLLRFVDYYCKERVTYRTCGSLLKSAAAGS